MPPPLVAMLLEADIARHARLIWLPRAYLVFPRIELLLLEYLDQTKVTEQIIRMALAARFLHGREMSPFHCKR